MDQLDELKKRVETLEAGNDELFGNLFDEGFDDSAFLPRIEELTAILGELAPLTEALKAYASPEEAAKIDEGMQEASSYLTLMRKEVEKLTKLTNGE